MITVVIPTLWKYKPFVNYLHSLCQVSVIDEIIIINNAVVDTPTDLILSNPKIKLLNMDENIYVNPAWNLGVYHSSNDKICISNDDITVDLNAFAKIDEFLTSGMGLIGLCPGRPEFNQPPITDGGIEFKPWQGEHTFGFGSFFCVHRESWNPIPHELKIYYGDNWAFDTQLRMNRQNWLMTNCSFYSPWAVSTSSIDASVWMEKETPIYASIVNLINTGHIVLN